jgi:hypothetical protein
MHISAASLTRPVIRLDYDLQHDRRRRLVQAEPPVTSCTSTHPNHHLIAFRDVAESDEHVE